MFTPTSAASTQPEMHFSQVPWQHSEFQTGWGRMRLLSQTIVASLLCPLDVQSQQVGDMIDLMTTSIGNCGGKAKCCPITSEGSFVFVRPTSAANACNPLPLGGCNPWESCACLKVHACHPSPGHWLKLHILCSLFTFSAVSMISNLMIVYMCYASGASGTEEGWCWGTDANL